MDISAPNPYSVVLCNPFKWDILWFILIKKSCYFCACHKRKINSIPQPQEKKSFRRQTECSSTLWGCLCTWPIWWLSTPTLSNEIFCGSFLIQNLAIFVCATTAKWILFLNHRNRKVVGGKHNVLAHYVNASAPDSSGVVLYNYFKWECLLFIISDPKSCFFVCACHKSEMNFIPQPQI